MLNRAVGTLRLLAAASLLTTALAAVPAAGTVSAETPPVSPFHAEYRIKFSYFEVGRYFLNLAVDGNGDYRYTSRAEPTGLVSFFTGRAFKELSRGTWQAGSPRPQLYRRSTKKGGDWEREEIHFDGKGGDGEGRPIPKDALDPASLVLALIYDAGHDQLRDHYTLVDKDGDVRRYRVADQGWSQVEAAGRTWRARKLTREGGNPHYGLTVYLAPRIGWLPVRIDYTDKGNEFEMFLVDAQGRDMPPEKAERDPRRFPAGPESKP